MALQLGCNGPSCRRVNLAVFLYLPLLLLLQSIRVVPAHTIVVRVGIVVGQVGQCSEMGDAHRGHQLFADTMATDEGAVHTILQDGKPHRIVFNYTRYDDECDSQKHEALLDRLINQDNVHFLFGSTPVFAQSESMMANDAQKIMYHCCVGPDILYEQNMKYVFGIQTSNTKYSLDSLKSMALAGNVKRLYIFSLRDNIFTSSTCDAGHEFVEAVLLQLVPDLEVVQHRKYTAEEASADPNFFRAIVEQAIDARADAILGCDFLDPGIEVTKLLADREYHLKALWLTVAPANDDFVSELGIEDSENVLTAGQWHPAMGYADAYFGTTADYVAAFEQAFGSQPSYVAAGATAASYSLAVAIQEAFQLCSFPAGMSRGFWADTLLFDEALNCVDELGRPLSGNGYDSVYESLSRQKLNTFFGRVEFNRYRRNVAKAAATTQIHSGSIEAVLPLEYSNKALVMPNPNPIIDVPVRSHTERIGSLQKVAFIVVVVVVVGSVLLVCLSGLAFLWWHKRQHSKENRHLIISPEDLKIIHLPVRRWDGISYESGKAIYKNALVSLDPLTEVRLSGWDVGWSNSNASRWGKRVSFTNEEGTQTDASNYKKQELQSAKTGPPDIEGDIEPFFLHPPSDMMGQPLPAPTPKAVHVTFKSQETMDLGAPGQHTEDCHIPQGNGGDIEQGSAFVMLSWARSLVTDRSMLAGSVQEPLSAAMSMPVSSVQEPLSTVLTTPASSVHKALSTVMSMPASSALEPSGPAKSVPASSAHYPASMTKSVPASSAQEPTGTVNTTKTLTKSQVLKLLWRSKHLQHPNIVPVIGVVWSLSPLPPSIAVLVRECEELGSLTEVMENMTMGLDAFKQTDIAKDTAQALAYLHAQDNPRLKPVLQPNLSSVMLNRYSRAKVCVPLPSLESVLTSKEFRLPTCCGEPKEDLNAAEKNPDNDDTDGCVRDNLLAPVHDEELEDVLRFGQGLACMLTIVPDTNTDRSTSETASRMTPSCSQGFINGTSLYESHFNEIKAGYGLGLANLITQCCATEKHVRPSFVQIHSRLEEMAPEIVKVATQAHHERECVKSPLMKKATVDELLYELFPSQVADALKSGRHPDPEPYSEVSLFFSDVCGYTNICSLLQPHDVMNMLHRLYSRFDTLAQELHLFKVETVGDAYLCVANLKHPQPEVHARLMAEFAFGCLEAANNELICPSMPELGNIHIRVGIHAGPVMGAVVGTLNRRFGIFGDAVNVASRMESTSIKDHIQCSAPFMKLLQDQWPECADLAVPQGAREIKGKGTMNTFMLFPLREGAEATLLKQHSGKRRAQFSM